MVKMTPCQIPTTWLKNILNLPKFLFDPLGWGIPPYLLLMLFGKTWEFQAEILKWIFHAMEYPNKHLQEFPHV